MTSTPSLADAFAGARARGRTALIAYVVAGDPDVETTERVVDALSSEGVDLIELGIPYGDPLADGPTIAAAAQRALGAGMTMRGAFELAGRVLRRGAPPVVYFTYANPVDRMGFARFAEEAAASGAVGAIVPDLSYEESGPLREALDERGLVLPLLVAPTTPRQRAHTIAAASTGFVYVVSRLGVTGARRRPDFAATAESVAAVREATSLPVAIGFGVSTAEDVHDVGRFADGAVIGSALIDAFAGSRGEEAARRAGAYIRSVIS